ncbi:MAG: nucleotide exchange factor GrpE [bacterium]|nr:nucleotide exchange factor GrpE [bacterium]
MSEDNRPENTANAENAEVAVNAENAGNAVSSENAGNSEKTENAGDAENAESKENTEKTENPEKAKPKPKPKAPSWFKPGSTFAAQGSPAASPAAPAAAQAAPGGDMLLGAPPADADTDDLLAPTQPSEDERSEAKDKKEEQPAPAPEASKEKLHWLLDSKPKAKPEPQDKADDVPLAKSSIPANKKINAEITALTKIVSSVESLAYLMPRLNRIANDGCELGDIVGLYRMVSQALLENLTTQSGIMVRMRETYNKNMRQFQEDVLFQQSSDLVRSVQEGGAVSSAEPPSEEKIQEDNVALAMLRKQVELKDDMLMKMRSECDAAQLRLEKMENDVKNIRTRQEKDLQFQLQRAKENLFKKILPVLDSFDGAVASSASFTDVSSVMAGLEGIYNQLMSSCKSEGLEIIQTKGQMFDPNLHEAMGHVETADLPEDSVYDELRRGYMLGGKLLRAAMVRLAKGGVATPVLPAEDNASVPAEVAEAGPNPEPQDESAPEQKAEPSEAASESGQDSEPSEPSPEPVQNSGSQEAQVSEPGTESSVSEQA